MMEDATNGVRTKTDLNTSDSMETREKEEKGD